MILTLDTANQQRGLESLRTPRRGLELMTLEPQSDGYVCAVGDGCVHRVQRENQGGTLVCVFKHNHALFVVRFPDHQSELSVLPLQDENLGSMPCHRLFISANLNDLGHILLTPFHGTGLARLLAQVVTDNALAQRGQAVAHVRLKHIRNTYLHCGLGIISETVISEAERADAHARALMLKAQGYQFDYESAQMLPTKLHMVRSVNPEEQRRLAPCNLTQNIRLIDTHGGFFRQRFIQR
jgi:hypothetical protein